MLQGEYLFFTGRSVTGIFIHGESPGEQKPVVLKKILIKILIFKFYNYETPGNS